MRFRSGRFAAILAALLFVASGFVHSVHTHEADRATTLHPACTLCQFHAPEASVGAIHGHAADPVAGTLLALNGQEAPPPRTPVALHASRAPPAIPAR